MAASPRHWLEGPERGLNGKAIAIILVAGYLVFAATYLPINAFSVGRAAHTLFLPGEESIPLVPEMEFLYLWTYVLPVLVVWKLPDADRLMRLVIAFAVTLIVAYATYLLYPVYFQRPPLVVHSVATLLLSLEYQDEPYNHFPSLHVAISWLVWLACRDQVRRRAPFLSLVIGISLSTVFVKQHYVVDLFAGAALAGAAWAIAGRWWPARAASVPTAPLTA